MTNIKDIVAEPNYNSAASGASKSSITVFVATFAYMVFFSRTSPGLIGGASFIVVGMFAVSLIVSLPVFLLRAKAPKIGSLLTIVDIGVTVLLTRFAYLWLFAQPTVVEAAPMTEAVPGAPRSFICDQPLPEFTLSATANPSDAELSELCACIDGKLSDTDKSVSKAISENRESEISSQDIQTFVPRFGATIQSCGGNRF